ncbi:hypothetical protein SAMN06264365_10592 [Actinoplanes regularis]|uniref:Uncharacterized protein n=1 Tax=Actinoplanes regularis TaxID=52697 RepID=A0A238YRM2_9ACTN|nr:hypothetical protein SAMN06264365_10592 [Actinoplanes regularis]
MITFTDPMSGHSIMLLVPVMSWAMEAEDARRIVAIPLGQAIGIARVLESAVISLDRIGCRPQGTDDLGQSHQNVQREAGACRLATSRTSPRVCARS